MATPDPTHTTVQTGKQQAEAYHTMALASEAIPRVENLLETLLELDEAANEGDPDLQQLASELHEASRQFSDLQKRANHLASTTDRQ